ncbi:MAG TPA: 30S ribosomal protein S9, partial [Cytophagaceae bacterium]|nr:30S ribosomal protein S9 [Cytophagaceae bacterium]
IGRRKTSVARIYITPGKGEILVNDRALNEYLPTEPLQISVRQPLVITNELANYNVSVNVQGGGITGQAEAIRMAIARALCDINPEHRPALKKEGFLTRDPRMVERKKFGKRKARKRFQFSKR